MLPEDYAANGCTNGWPADRVVCEPNDYGRSIKDESWWLVSHPTPVSAMRVWTRQGNGGGCGLISGNLPRRHIPARIATVLEQSPVPLFHMVVLACSSDWVPVEYRTFRFRGQLNERGLPVHFSAAP